MSDTQAERVETLMPEVGCTFSPGEACEPEDVRAVITSLVAENEALRADARRATRLLDAVRQFRCERVLERAAALRQTLGYCALVDAWEDCADAGMGTEPGRAGAARNTAQHQGG